MGEIQTLFAFAARSAEHWPHWGIGPILAFLALAVTKLHVPDTAYAEAVSTIRRAFVNVRVFLHTKKTVIAIGLIAFSVIWSNYLAFVDVYVPEPDLEIAHFSINDVIDRRNIAEYRNYLLIFDLKTNKTLKNPYIEVHSVRFRAEDEIDYEYIDLVHFSICRYNFGKDSGGCFSTPILTGDEHYSFMNIDASGENAEIILNGDEPEHRPIKHLMAGDYIFEIVITADNIVNGSVFLAKLHFEGKVDSVRLAWTKER